MSLTYRWQATFVIGLGLLMSILDTTIVSVVLPQIATALHADYQTSTWIGTGYLLANAAVIPVIGYLSDRVGSKRIFLLALGIFTLGSALCALAPSVPVLIAFRIVQGIGGGALLPVGMAIIFRLFDPTERARATAVLMIPILLGPAFGPTLGGYLATVANWNAIFLINLPIGAVALALALVVLRDKTEEQAAEGLDQTPNMPHVDWLGLALAVASFTALVYGFTLAGIDGWSNPVVIGGLVVGGILLVAFILIELRVADPVLDLRLFRNYTFAVTNALAWVSSSVFFAGLFLVPVFFERVEHLSALATGEIVITQGLAMAVGLALSGRFYNRVGPRLLTVIGAILVTISQIGFIHLTVTTTGADLQLWLIMRGLGLGLFIQPLQTLSVSVVSRAQMAKATSLRTSTTTVVNAVGVAVLTSYLTQQATTHIKDATSICLAQEGSHLTTSALQACVGQQSLTLGMNDTFFFALMACAVCAVAAFFVGRDPALDAAKAARKRSEHGEEKIRQAVTS